MKPEYDKDGYVTEETLEKIENWPVNKRGLLDFVVNAWDKHYGKIERFQPERGTLEWHMALITGGWSDNEAIFSSFSRNPAFAIYWVSSHRGGRHVVEDFVMEV